MVAPTYQDVVRANGGWLSWALTETSGTTFVPWLGVGNMSGSGTFLYQQTGPFATAFGLHLAASTQVHFAFTSVIQPPFTQECWIKFDSLTLATNAYLIKTGADGTNGSGFYVKSTDKHVHQEQGGVQDLDTLFVWPDTNWHLVDWVSETGTQDSFYFDGTLMYRAAHSVGNTPSPNVEAFASNGSGTTTNVVGLIAYPTLYPRALTSTEVFAQFLASTDPTSALAFTATGGGAAPGGSQAILQQILNAVFKSF